VTKTERLVSALRDEANELRTDRHRVEQSVADGKIKLAQYGAAVLGRLEKLLIKAAAEIERHNNG
jgi:hypothetical protein